MGERAVRPIQRRGGNVSFPVPQRGGSPATGDEDVPAPRAIVMKWPLSKAGVVPQKLLRVGGSSLTVCTRLIWPGRSRFDDHHVVSAFGLVAQSVEQRPFKPLVEGSSPSQPTISFSFLAPMPPVSKNFSLPISAWSGKVKSHSRVAANMENL